jgi:hypothetical protein
MVVWPHYHFASSLRETRASPAPEAKYRDFEMTLPLEIAVVGAGPYGLSIGAHLQACGIPFQIFGPPMQTWREHMPKGMLLKSDGFASNLSDPSAALTLKTYCSAQKIAYDDTRVPVRLDTFVNYGMAFQHRFLPGLDQRLISLLEQTPAGFQLTLEDGEKLDARRVVLAVGITHFAYLPENLSGLPEEFLSHASRHSDLEKFRGKAVAVIGAGASAVDIAALLHESGANVSLVARRKAIAFHDPPSPNGRSLWERIRRPSSGLGPAWPSRFFTDAPGLFRYFPTDTRIRIVKEYLGPAPGWPMRERVVGKFPLHLGSSDIRARMQDGKPHLTFTAPDGNSHDLAFDHIIAATGYRADLSRLKFLSDGVRRQLKSVSNTPVLSKSFESSIPGLYFVGISAAHSFGPMMRFAYGSDYTAHRVARHVVRSVRA